MPNSFFRFKKFTIQQGQTAMKVCTDACILGAYTPVDDAQRILDIGTGTGLLALMLAQRARAGKVDAVEIEPNAFQQALQNVQESPFSSQITLYHTAIQDFVPEARYDLIVTNPPFYTNYLQSGNINQDNAWHTNTLPTKALLASVTRLLAEAGKAWILLPPYQMAVCTAEAEQFGLYPFERLEICTLPTKPLWRVIQGFAKQKQDLACHALCISEQPQVYSTLFKELLRDYYLYL